MTDAAFTLEERNRLVTALYESRRQTSWPIFQTLTSAQRKREYAKQDKLLDLYGMRLPALPLSRCPLCGDTLHYVIDLMGFDGPWWHETKLAEFPLPSEPHFRVLLGAINFYGRQPLEAACHPSVRPGPEVPYVIPRLLELPGMQVVISSLTLPSGDTAYVMAYFSPAPIHGALLHQSWGRSSYEILDEQGENQGWGAANDVWDFDLQPWINKGQVSWILPNDESLTLRNQGPCPYVDLPGERRPQELIKGQRFLRELPDGSKLQPFE